MLKLIAISLNILLLSCGFWVIARYGLPENAEAMFIYLLLFLVPIVNLFTIIFSKAEDWLSLYFKRKAIEEKRKIAELEKE